MSVGLNGTQDFFLSGAEVLCSRIGSIVSFVHFSRSWLGMQGGFEALDRRSPELRDWEGGWPCPGVLRAPGARACWRVVQRSPSTISKFFILSQTIQLAPLRGFVTPNRPSSPRHGLDVVPVLVERTRRVSL